MISSIEFWVNGFQKSISGLEFENLMCGQESSWWSRCAPEYITRIYPEPSIQVGWNLEWRLIFQAPKRWGEADVWIPRRELWMLALTLDFTSLWLMTYELRLTTKCWVKNWRISAIKRTFVTSASTFLWLNLLQRLWTYQWCMRGMPPTDIAPQTCVYQGSHSVNRNVN